MALALVPRARGRGEKTANFWQKSSTFDPISEGTRRKKTAAGTTGRWIDMRFSKPPGFFPDKLIGYWIEHRASRTSGSCGGNEHRTGSRCMFKLFCLFACLFSFDKHRASSIEHRASSIEHRASNHWTRPAILYVWGIVQAARGRLFNCQSLEIKKAATGAAYRRYERLSIQSI